MFSGREKMGNSEEKNQIRFVCLSDLHLGEPCSILNVKSEDKIYASKVMENLKTCLRSLLADGTSKIVSRPTLILNGDIMDLALGRIEHSLMMFELFMGLIMENGKELFNPRVIILPGNHDHHIWEAERETQYVESIGTKPLKILPPPKHSTGMVLGQNFVKSRFLTKMLQRYTTMKVHNEQSNRYKYLFSTLLEIQVSYPNLAILSEDKKKCAIIHHGHFTEESYYLVSSLNHKLTKAEFPKDMDTLERENFAWIDFLWSALGRSGSPGGTVDNIYEYLKNPQLSGPFFDMISQNIVENESNRLRFLPKSLKVKVLKLIFRKISPSIRGLLGERNQREDADDLVNQDIKNRLSQLLRLSWPLIEPNLKIPENSSTLDLALIYGHTHKPFVESKLDLGKIERENSQTKINPKIDVYNTGGWIVDQIEADTKIGASIVLMDCNLNLVSLQVYREGGTEKGLGNVLIKSTNDQTEFYQYIKEKIENQMESQKNCWKDLINSVNAEYVIKANSLKKHLSPALQTYSTISAESS
jgi:hypothetical protein